MFPQNRKTPVPRIIRGVGALIAARQFRSWSRVGQQSVCPSSRIRFKFTAGTKRQKIPINMLCRPVPSQSAGFSNIQANLGRREIVAGSSVQIIAMADRVLRCKYLCDGD